MAIDFPSGPTAGVTTYTYLGVTYLYAVGEYWTVTTPGSVGVATGVEIDSGTDNVKYLTPKGIEDSSYAKEAYTDAAVLPINTRLDEHLRVPNILYNQQMEFFERQVSAGVPSNGGFQYCADRWAGRQEDMTSHLITREQNSGTNHDKYGSKYAKNTIVSSGNNNEQCQFTQILLDVRNLAGKTFTVRFSTLASSALKVGVEAQTYFGGGGSSTIFTDIGTVNAGTLITDHEFTFTAPEVGAATVGINSGFKLAFWLSAGADFAGRTDVGHQSGEISLMNVSMVEEGALPQRYDSIHERMRCKEFLHVLREGPAGSSSPVCLLAKYVSNANANGIIHFPVTMRVAPTLIQSSNAINAYFAGSNSLATQVFLNRSDVYAMEIIFTSNLGGQGQAGWARFNSVGAFLGFDAEIYQ